ncbi:MAG: TlpA disulfide reductase family protein [Gammaproteobacteria bacterium]|jgi:peroxiredoxin
MKQTRLILCSFLLILSCLGTAQAEQPLGHDLAPLPKPIRAPAFTLQDGDGNSVSLSDYKGKVILLNFWGTWCPPCRHEMPSMQRLYKRLHSKGFVVLAVNQTETPGDVFIFTSQLSVTPTFKILYDKKSDIAAKYRVVGLPTTFLIDKQGMIRYRAIGGRDFNSPRVEQKISSLISEK